MKRILAVLFAVAFSLEAATYYTFGVKGTFDIFESFAGVERVACK